MKLIDIDKLFEKYLRDLMTKNAGKYTEDQWEAKMPELYQKFGDAPLEELNGASPRAYFATLSGEELVQTLTAYVEKEVGVPDYLCDAITENAQTEAPLLALVNPETEEELLSYALNLLEERGSTVALRTYFNALFSPDYSDEIKEIMTEMLALHPAAVNKDAIACYKKANEKQKGYLLDIIVEGEKSDAAFEILLSAFKAHKDDIPLYVQYLVKYGDDRALPTLYKAIDNPSVDYLSFQELRNAIEALGGEYDKKRDFSEDRFYKAVLRAQKAQEEDPS